MTSARAGGTYKILVSSYTHALFLCLFLRRNRAETTSKQPAPSARVIAMPDAAEIELYQHVVWLCENSYPATWDSIKALAWQLGKSTGLHGEGKGGDGMGRRDRGGVYSLIQVAAVVVSP